MSEELGRRVSVVAALADPVRRALYERVAEQDGPLSREQAAALAAVPVHTARFHLDRLVAAGLLDVEYRRLSGRSGPGAGRPAKLYRTVADEVAVSVPPRRYDLAGALLAAAVEESGRSGAPVSQALDDVARRRGRALASALAPPVPDASASPSASPSAQTALGRAAALLAEHGYAPRVVGAQIHLANCPFHALAREHTALVCGMNLALLDGVVEGLEGPTGTTGQGDRGAHEERLRARLDPGEGRCCVVLAVEPGDQEA